MSVKEDIEQMVSNIVSGNSEEAAQQFQSVLADKMNAALENIKVDVATSMFGGKGAE